jgi:predicted dienelactone hydrolase
MNCLSRRMRIGWILIVFLATTGATSAWALPSPNGPGDLLVGHTEDSIVDAARANRTLPLHIWYPADVTEWNAAIDFSFFSLFGAIGITSTASKDNVAVAAGQFPLVVFSHGFGGVPDQSLKLMEHLASHGFVVVSISHTGNTQDDMSSLDPEADRYPDVAFTIDEMGLMNINGANRFFGHVDNQNVGVAGHSYGGMTAEFMAAGHGGLPADTRVKAIFPIAASSSTLSDAELTGITVPTLLMVGTLDGLISEQDRAYGLISASTLHRVDVIGATHTHFANICDIGQALIDGGLDQSTWVAIGAGALIGPYEATCEPPAFDIDEATRIQNLYAAAHFRAFLNGEAEYLDYLTVTYAQENEAYLAFDGVDPILLPAVPGLGVLAQGVLVLLLGAGVQLRRKRA